METFVGGLGDQSSGHPGAAAVDPGGFAALVPGLGAGDGGASTPRTLAGGATSPASAGAGDERLAQMCERMEQAFGSISSRLSALEARPAGSPGDTAGTRVSGTPFGNALGEGQAAQQRAAAADLLRGPAGQSPAPILGASRPGAGSSALRAKPPGARLQPDLGPQVGARAPGPAVEGALATALSGLGAVLQRLESRWDDSGGLPESMEELSSMGLSSGGGGRLGVTQIEKLKRSREQRPELTSSAHEKEVMEDLKVLPGEAWSYSRHAEQMVLPQAAGYHGLRKTIVILASALDLHRAKGPEHARAFVAQAYKAAQCAASHPQHQWGYGWPLLGIPDPDGAAKPGYTSAEASALSAWHRDQQLWLQSLHGHGAGKGPHNAAGGSPGGAVGAAGEDNKLRAEIERLKKDLVEERKKQKKGDKGGKAEGGKGRVEP